MMEASVRTLRWKVDESSASHKIAGSCPVQCWVSLGHRAEGRHSFQGTSDLTDSSGCLSGVKLISRRQRRGMRAYFQTCVHLQAGIYCRTQRLGIFHGQCALPGTHLAGKLPRGTMLHTRPDGRQTSCSAASDHVGSLDARGLRMGVVVARFNDLVTKLLLEGALDAFKRQGGAESEVVWVPGSFELPLVAKAMAKSGKFDAILTIGAVVRGATTHYEAVVNSATSGSLSASLESGVPVVFGVLTTETMEQALDRAGGKVGNKGFECAVTAVEMANLIKSLRAQGLAAEPWGVGRS